MSAHPAAHAIFTGDHCLRMWSRKVAPAMLKFAAANGLQIEALYREPKACTPPEGWALTPASPSPDMIEAICAELAADERKAWPEGYGALRQGAMRAMARHAFEAALAVAPEPPANPARA
jgi:hypothetical protein